MLKAQLHIHFNEDLYDRLNYSAKEVIDKAAELNFNVLSFTLHKTLYWNEEINEYAKSKNILLIPGMEANIEGKDVLIYGLKKDPKITKLKDLEKIKDKALIIAPHPYLMRSYALKDKTIEFMYLFDGLEYNFYYNRFFNPHNKKISKIAKKYNKPLIGMGDIHRLSWFDSTYSLIDADKNINSIFNAIKENKIKKVTRPLSIIEFIKISIQLVFFT